MEARTAASSNVRKRSDTERFRDAAQGRQRAFLAPAQRLALKGDKLTRPRANAPSDLAERIAPPRLARADLHAALAQETEQKARGVRQGVSAIGLAQTGRLGPSRTAVMWAVRSTPSRTCVRHASMMPRWRLMSALVSPAGGRADHNDIAWSLAIVVDAKRGLGITAPEPTRVIDESRSR
jgi:hypothetical protein